MATKANSDVTSSLITSSLTSELAVDRSHNDMVDFSVPLFMRGFFVAIGTMGLLGNLFVFMVLAKHLSRSYCRYVKQM